MTLNISAKAFAGAAALALFIAPATAEAACPAEIEPGGSKFRYVSFFEGDPADLFELAPDSDRSRRGRLDLRWDFSPDPDRPIVMLCRYHGAEAVIRRNLDPSVKSCRLKGRIDSRGEIAGSPRLRCR